MNPIQNRFEFLMIFDCENGNPNGDPDADNLPRTDLQDGHGLVSDVSIKRRIRDYAQLMGQQIFYQHEINLNRLILEARVQAGNVKSKPTLEATQSAAAILCERFYDVRTFGAALSTGANAGKLTGPVQISNARTIDPVDIIEMTITRNSVAEDLSKTSTVADYARWEAEQPRDKLRTMGRKSLIPYGLYSAKGFISAFQAAATGFSNDDLATLCESLLNMYEHNRSSSKGLMTMRRFLMFKHVGNSRDREQSIKQAMLGRAPAQHLLEQGRVVTITRNDPQQAPRRYADYSVTVNRERLPDGVEMLDLEIWDEELFRNWLKSREPGVAKKRL
jgi:CRISPR-associated protein Csd2